jgi:hypothetical protein
MQSISLKDEDKFHPHEHDNAALPEETAASSISHSLPMPLLTRIFMDEMADNGVSAAK